MTTAQTHTRNDTLVLARMIAFFCPSLLYRSSPALFLVLHFAQVLIIALAFRDAELSLASYAIFIVVINLFYSVIRRSK